MGQVLNPYLTWSGLPKIKSAYIVGPVFDGLLIISTPLLCLLFAALLVGLGLDEAPFDVFGQEMTLLPALGATLSIGHLYLVFFRSHLNPQIFKQFPVRFIAVPVVLFAALVFSKTFLVCAVVFKMFFDHYHSSMQTFGFARIYDAKAGNAPERCRALDRGLALVIYCWPLLAGVTLLDHLDVFNEFDSLGWDIFTVIPAQASENHHLIFMVSAGLGLAYLGYYLYSYYRLYQEGHHISAQKVILFAVAGTCVIFTWGFNSFGHSFFVMESFHAVQYFAFVWWVERKNIRATLRLEAQSTKGDVALLAGFIGYGLATGFLTLYFIELPLVFASMVWVALLHFWYDGFIWSVRKRQIP